MTRAQTAMLAAAAAVVAPALAALMARSSGAQRLENYRGNRIPVILGQSWFGALSVASLGLYFLGFPQASSGRTLWFVAYLGALVMTLAGLLDDRRGGPDRGFPAHLASLARLRPTTGAVKLLAGGIVSVWVALLIGEGIVHVVGAALLIALATNLVNALDVRPGRALKVSLPVLVLGWVAATGEPIAILLATASGAAVGILPFDLGETAMLGDAGSNPIGFVAGVGLAATLPTWGVLVGVGVAVVLQVVAETVTISRLIDAVPPLKWFDGLGRRN